MILVVTKTSDQTRQKGHTLYLYKSYLSPEHLVCVYVCVFFPFILDIKFVGRTSRGHTEGRSHRISLPSSFCGACLNFSREKDSAFTFPLSTVKSNFVYYYDLTVPHLLGIFFILFYLYFS